MKKKKRVVVSAAPHTVDRDHDASYRQLFSYREIVALLLGDFVGARRLGVLDLSNMERQDTMFVGEALLRRQADMIWRVPRPPGVEGLPVYVLLEFQSTVDPSMPVRMMGYSALVYQALGKADSACMTHGGLPPVVSIVLYNGVAPWRAPRSMRELIACDSKSSLYPLQPQLKLHMIDVGRLSRRELDRSDTVLSALFKLERVRTSEQLRAQVREIGRLVRDGQLERLRVDILLWIRELLKGRGIVLEVSELKSFQEVDSMLAERMDQWSKDFEAKGLKKGQLEARRELLLLQMNAKFGEAAGRVEAIEALSLKELDRAALRILDAETPEAVLKPT